MKKSPNIIVFMTDHQRGDTIFTDNIIKTPNIDKFRKKSVVFKNAYCPAPHCCPSRATFFTGLYPTQHGVWNNVDVSNTLSKGLYDGVKTFSEDLKENGYTLYYSGKWHVSSEESPEDRGFEMIYPTDKERYRKYTHKPDNTEWKWYEGMNNSTSDKAREEGEIIRPGYPKYIQYGINEHPYNDHIVVEKALDKLKNISENENFMMFIGTLGPHDPYYVPERFLNIYDINDIKLPNNFYDDLKDKPVLYRRTQDRFNQLTEEEHKESIRRFYAFCSYEDYLFGKVLDGIRESNREKDTIIMYVSDHGDYIGAHRLWAKGLPCFREAYHICSVIGGANIVEPNREVTDLISLADYAPTILELAGIKVDRRFIGQSLIPYLKNENYESKWKEMYTQTNGNEIYGIQRSVWNNRYKYVYNTFDYDELYDLRNDPLELNNLIHNQKDVNAGEYAEVIKELTKKMWSFAKETGDNCVNPYIMTALAPYGPGIIYEEDESI